MTTSINEHRIGFKRSSRIYRQNILPALFGFLLFASSHLAAQVTLVPSELYENQGVQVIFDASGTALASATKVYIHSGIDTNFTDFNTSTFDLVVGDWGLDNGVGEMTSIGADLWSIDISDFRTYFGGPSLSGDIFGFNYLFRNADGTTQVNDGGSDFMDMVTACPGSAKGFNYSESAILLEVSSSAITYDLTGTTNANPFHNVNLGTFSTGSSDLILNGASASTFKETNGSTDQGCHGGNVCIPLVNYIVYETGNRPTGFEYGEMFVNFESESGGNQTWLTSDAGIDLTYLSAGNYTLELYMQFSGSMTNGTDCGDFLFDYAVAPNQPYLATFTIDGTVSYPNVTVTDLTTDPTLEQSGGIIVTFDATGTELEGLSNVYLHSGVSTDLDEPRQFEIVTGNWGQDDGIGQMTNTGGNIWQITIADIDTYFNLDSEDDVFGFNFLFRSADGSSQEGNSGNNYYYPVDPGAYVIVNMPTASDNVGQVGSTQEVNATASAVANWTLQEVDENGVVLNTLDMQSGLLNYSFDYSIIDVFNKNLRIVADIGGEIVTKSFSITGFEPTQNVARPAGVQPGINYLDDDCTSAILVLHAPTCVEYLKGDGSVGGVAYTTPKEVVHVIGDFNNWEISESYKMFRDRDGWDGTQLSPPNCVGNGDYFWIQIDNLEPGRPYVFQYLVEGETRIGDPYTFQISDSEDPQIGSEVYPDLVDYPSDQTTGRASVIQTCQKEYVFEVENFTPVDQSDLHIYELHFRDFTEEGTYLAAIEHLDHIKQLGFNAIHVMPVSEFEGNTSWGYNPNYYFAADKAYGTPNDLKQFIDEAHKRDIAVFNDLVLNHAFGSNPNALMYWDEANNRPDPDNPWFNATHRMVRNMAGWWGNDWNHESEFTQAFVDRALDFWLQEYKFDGFRFDFTKGIGQTDPNDFPFGDEWASSYNQDRIDLLLRMVNGMKSRNPGSIAIFEHLANQSEDAVLANAGILMWSGVGHHNDVKNMILGFGGSNIYSSGVWQAKGFNSPHWISYSESHDEERLAYEVYNFGNGISTITDPAVRLTETIERLKIGAAFNLLLEGPRMIWEFQEFGYDYSINFNGRTGEKPVAWTLGYDQDADRQELELLMSQLLNARNERNFTNFNYDNLGNGTQTVKRMTVSNAAGEEIIVIANLDASTGQNLFPQYSQTGTWYRNNGDEFVDNTITVGNVNDSYFLDPGRVLVLSNFPLGVPMVTDTDGDGIYDDQDACVALPGIAQLNGCPNEVSISVDKTDAVEGDTFFITATMQHAINEDVQIGVLITGDATNGTDYEQVVQITIPACFNTGVFALSTIDDGQSENTETIQLTIDDSAITNAQAAASDQSVLMNLLDNDCTGVACPTEFPWKD